MSNLTLMCKMITEFQALAVLAASTKYLRYEGKVVRLPRVLMATMDNTSLVERQRKGVYHKWRKRRPTEFKLLLKFLLFLVFLLLQSLIEGTWVVLFLWNLWGVHKTFTVDASMAAHVSEVYMCLPSGSSGFLTFSHSSCLFFLLSSSSDSDTNFLLRSTPAPPSPAMTAALHRDEQRCFTSEYHANKKATGSLKTGLFLPWIHSNLFQHVKAVLA